MSNAAIDTDVLIVGAGPVGLFNGQRVCPARPAVATGRDSLIAVGALESARDFSPDA